jgi:hypothetical protein
MVMPGDDETIGDPFVADVRNFYKVELWTAKTNRAHAVCGD